MKNFPSHEKGLLLIGIHAIHLDSLMTTPEDFEEPTNLCEISSHSQTFASAPKLKIQSMRAAQKVYLLVVVDPLQFLNFFLLIL